MTQSYNERAHYQSKDGIHSLTWGASRVWNLGSFSQLETAWAWSEDNVSCPNEITNWSFWDKNNQVQNAKGSLRFVCQTPTGKLIRFQTIFMHLNIYFNFYVCLSFSPCISI